MKLNCEINLEEADNRIDSLKSMVDLITHLLSKIYNIISGKWLADIIKENL